MIQNYFFESRYEVGDHNSRGHQSMSLELVWGPKGWPKRLLEVPRPQHTNRIVMKFCVDC
eukprot:scaffold1863_cov85-Cylindrotheca_fusiformis.AAC.2